MSKDPRPQKPIIEICNQIAEGGYIKEIIAAMMIQYEDRPVREAMLYSIADKLIVESGYCRASLIGKRRLPWIVKQRHTVILQLRAMGFSSKEIAAYFNRDRTSVVYVCNKYRESNNEAI